MIPFEDRFWGKVEVHGTCWVWTGATNRDGYGIARLTNPRLAARAHRVAYELLVGPIPEGMTLDHLCRVPACVNPDHLEPCTQGQNLHRSPITRTSINAAKTHCPAGHAYSEMNTYHRHGRRYCRQCQSGRRRVALP